MLPRAERKWSPAELVEHVSLTYEVLLNELAGGAGMAVRTSFWKRALLRLKYLPGILRGEAFPKGAPAPRELRPSTPTLTQSEAIARLQRLAARFDAETAAAVSQRRGARFTHAYFGALSVPQGVALCASHVRHHAGQLP